MAEQRVGFIGLGAMGKPMAGRLIKAGYPLTIYNRTPGKAKDLIALEAAVVGSPREVAREADVVITMLTDSPAVEAVALGEEGVLAGARQGLTFIDMSSILPETSRRLAAEARRRGVAMLDAPVAGTVGPAQQGTLTVMVGGEREVYDRVLPILQVLGNNIFYAGGHGLGSAMKIAVNMLLTSQLQVLAEALVLGKKAGLDQSQMIEVFGTTSSGSPAVKSRGQVMVSQSFAPAFALRLAQKDLTQAIAYASELGVPVPATSATHVVYTAARSKGLGDLDFSGVYKLMAELGGLA